MNNKNVINLRAHRKEKQRDLKRSIGDGNAAKFGRTKTESKAQDTQIARDTKRLDDHKRDP